MASPAPRRFYRILDRALAEQYDFMSNAKRGIEPKRPLSPREMDRWHGISVMATPRSARKRMQVSPWLGSFVAVIEIPRDARVRIAQTTRDLDHFTIWADAHDLLSWVVAILRLDELE